MTKPKYIIRKNQSTLKFRDRTFEDFSTTVSNIDHYLFQKRPKIRRTHLKKFQIVRKFIDLYADFNIQRRKNSLFTNKNTVIEMRERVNKIFDSVLEEDLKPDSPAALLAPAVMSAFVLGFSLGRTDKEIRRITISMNKKMWKEQTSNARNNQKHVKYLIIIDEKIKYLVDKLWYKSDGINYKFFRKLGSTARSIQNNFNDVLKSVELQMKVGVLPDQWKHIPTDKLAKKGSKKDREQSALIARQTENIRSRLRVLYRDLEAADDEEG